MPLQAIFSDMDGTLLNPQHKISDYTASVLQRLRAKGIRVILATGRPYMDVFETIRKCKLKPDYIITSDGARIHDGNFNLVRQHNIDPEVVYHLARLHRLQSSSGEWVEKKATTHIFFDGECLADRAVPEFSAVFDEAYTFVNVGDKLRELQLDELTSVPQALFHGPHHDLEPVREHLETHFKADLCWTYSLPYLLNCAPHGVSKGCAVREVSEMLGIPLSEVACFGDGMNDESMLQIAGKAYITENAQQRLKDAVPHGEVIGSNAEDGVAKKLEELFLVS